MPFGTNGSGPMVPVACHPEVTPRPKTQFMLRVGVVYSVRLVMLTPESLSTKALFMSLQYKWYTVLFPTPRGTLAPWGTFHVYYMYVKNPASLIKLLFGWTSVLGALLSWGRPWARLPPGPAPSHSLATSSCVHPRSSGAAVPAHARQ